MKNQFSFLLLFLLWVPNFIFAQNVFTTDEINKNLNEAQAISHKLIEEWHLSKKAGISLESHNESLRMMLKNISDPDINIPEVLEKQELLVLQQMADSITNLSLNIMFGNKNKAQLKDSNLVIHDPYFKDAIQYIQRKQTNNISDVLVIYPSQWDHSVGLAKYVPPIYFSKELPTSFLLRLPKHNQAWTLAYGAYISFKNIDAFVEELIKRIFGTQRLFFVDSLILIEEDSEKINSIAVHELKHLFDFEETPEEFNLYVRSEENARLEELLKKNTPQIMGPDYNDYIKSSAYKSAYSDLMEIYISFDLKISNKELEDLVVNKIKELYTTQSNRLFKYFHTRTERSAIREETKFLTEAYAYTEDLTIERRRKLSEIPDPLQLKAHQWLSIPLGPSIDKELRLIYKEANLEKDFNKLIGFHQKSAQAHLSTPALPPVVCE